MSHLPFLYQKPGHAKTPSEIEMTMILESHIYYREYGSGLVCSVTRGEGIAPALMAFGGEGELVWGTC